jgi:hypothetical protein|nr:MAG TPA: hypothetical protein [Caudoviricetes sp.]
MKHFWHQVEQQIVGDTQYYTIHRFIDVNRAELAIIFWYQCSMGWRDFILAFQHCIGNRQSGMLISQPYELVFANVFEHSFLNCFRPSVDVEKHMQNFICHNLHFIGFIQSS